MEGKLQAEVRASDFGGNLMCVEKREKAAQLGSVRGRVWRRAEKGPGTQGPPKSAQPCGLRLRIQNYSE